MEQVMPTDITIAQTGFMVVATLVLLSYSEFKMKRSAAPRTAAA
jgi:hypothetical protein